MGCTPSIANCPTCPLSRDQQTCVPYIVKSIVPLINDYLAAMADKPLGVVKDCKLGTLRKISLCKLANVKVKTTRTTCDLDITVHSVTGANHIHLKQFDYEVNTAGTGFVLSLGIIFGMLQVELSAIPIRESCNILSRSITSLITCDHKTATFGSLANPANLHVALLIPLDCKSAGQITIKDIKFDLGAFQFNCFKALDWLPASFTANLVARVSNKITDVLRSFLVNLIQATFELFTVVAAVTPQQSTSRPSYKSRRSKTRKHQTAQTRKRITRPKRTKERKSTDKPKILR